MKSCKLIIKDEVNLKVEGLPIEVRRKLVNAFKYQDPTARYRPSYQLGRWDGSVTLFGLGGNGYLNQLPKILSKSEPEEKPANSLPFDLVLLADFEIEFEGTSLTARIK